MKTYNIDFVNGIVTLYPAFLRKASSLGTKEYREMLELRRNHADFQFVKADAPKQKTANKAKNLTYANMELFIRNSFDSEKSKSLLEELSRVKALSKIQASPYAYVRKWFLENYANYAEDPEFDANGFVIVKTKSQMEAEKKAKAQEEAKRAEEVAAAEAQEVSDAHEQEIKAPAA